jgi:serine/threonine-protein phosphatase 6 regulatory ankyrin repeat subunit B
MADMYSQYEQNDQMARKRELVDLIRANETLEKADFDKIQSIIEGSPQEWRLANTKKKDGTSILMIAARQGLSKLVTYLLDQGAHVSSVNRDHSDALMFACVSGKKDIVEQILLAKADCNFTNRQGVSALMVAAERGHEKIVQLLLEEYKVDFNKKMKNGATALTFAISSKHPEIVDLLITAKADVNQAMKDGTTPLMLAAERNHPGIVQTLLNCGALVTATRNQTQETALHIAAHVQGGAKLTVQRLLDSKADVHACDVDGRQPLMYAVVNVEITKILLASGADVNAPDDGGNTPLMYACAQTAPPVSILGLIAGKADVEVKNERGETALSLANALGRTEYVNLFNYYTKHKKK